MRPTDPLISIGWEDASLTVMARIQGNAGTNITQASLSSITCKVFDLDNANVVVATPAVTISSAVFDSLQTTDPRWTKDTTGYNFRFTVTASSFPTGSRRYQIEFVFTPTSGDVFPLVVKHTTQELLGS